MSVQTSVILHFKTKKMDKGHGILSSYQNSDAAWTLRWMVLLQKVLNKSHSCLAAKCIRGISITSSHKEQRI